MRRAVLTLTLILTVTPLTGCGGDPPVSALPSGQPSSTVAAGPTAPRAQLAARVAAAKDLRQVAFYTLRTAKRRDRQVSIIRATDGSWRVDIPGGAHGGAVDIALVFSGGILYQCGLPTGAQPKSGCVVMPAELKPTADPKIQHLISDWLGALTDRNLALAISLAQPLAETSGQCFSVESSATSLTMPIDAGIYCYETDGTLTGARLSFGTLTLAGKPAAAPPKVDLPGGIVSGPPLPLAAPPSPSPSASPSGKS